MADRQEHKIIEFEENNGEHDVDIKWPDPVDDPGFEPDEPWARDRE